MTEKIFKYIIDVEYDPETGEEESTTVLKTDRTSNTLNWDILVSAMYTHHSVFEDIVKELNKLYEENEDLKKQRNYLIGILENQSLIIQELGAKLLEYETEEPITLTKEDLEIMGKALSYYIYEGGLND